MKDIHSHIIWGIDDGSESIEESINILRQAENNGYTDLILTPHYRTKQNFIEDNKSKKEKLEILKEEARKNGIRLNLYLGNEITVDDDFFYLLDTDQIMPLVNSRYILLELPFTGRYAKLNEILDGLDDRGYIPVIAHPERYEDYSIKDYEEMLDKGVLLQGNADSLFGKYGKETKVKLEELLKLHMISFIGSDIHKEDNNSFNRIKLVEEKLLLLTKSEKITKDLIDVNIDKVIQNKEIKKYPKCIKKLKFKFRLFA